MGLAKFGPATKRIQVPIQAGYNSISAEDGQAEPLPAGLPPLVGEAGLGLFMIWTEFTHISP